LTEQTPLFPSVAIIGFGFIGGSLGLAVKQRWPSAVVIAIDQKPVLERALRMRAADLVGEQLELAADASLVVLAAPVLANIEVLRRLPEAMSGNAVVTDVGSTKAATVAAAAELPERFQFVGGHPLAGGAVGGIGEARAELFEGRPWLLTPDGSTDALALSSITAFIEALGGAPVNMAPDAHDRMVAYLSHLPQLVVTALMHVVGEAVGADRLALAGAGLRDTTRLASSPAGIWRDIAATNPGQVSQAIAALIDVLGRLRTQVARPDADFDELFASARRWKETLDGN
jgi:prephenate dehydrogenase